MAGSLPPDSVTWAELLRQTTETVGDRMVARWLCEHASGLDGPDFSAELTGIVSARSGLHLESMVRRYLAGEPLQYVMGRWAFRRLDMMVDQRVLIPRPETEQLVDLALRYLSESSDARRDAPKVVVDLGTGSGAIGLSILAESPVGSVDVHLTDMSHDALDVARANAAGVGRAAANLSVHHGQWYDALPDVLRGRCSAVLSNPPYIAVGDDAVESVVKEWEPHSALYSGVDGLDDVRVIVAGANEWLAPGGLLLVEIGHSHGDSVAELLADSGMVNCEILRDHSGRTRFARAYAPR